MGDVKVDNVAGEAKYVYNARANAPVESNHRDVPIVINNINFKTLLKLIFLYLLIIIVIVGPIILIILGSIGIHKYKSMKEQCNYQNNALAFYCNPGINQTFQFEYKSSQVYIPQEDTTIVIMDSTLKFISTNNTYEFETDNIGGIGGYVYSDGTLIRYITPINQVDDIYTIQSWLERTNNRFKCCVPGTEGYNVCPVCLSEISFTSKYRASKASVVLGCFGVALLPGAANGLYEFYILPIKRSIVG
jgi:hypothetical protein